MDFNQYYCNLEQVYLAITNTSLEDDMYFHIPSPEEISTHFITFWFDKAPNSSGKRIDITTILQTRRRKIPRSDIFVTLYNPFKSPLSTIYDLKQSDEFAKELKIKYLVYI